MQLGALTISQRHLLRQQQETSFICSMATGLISHKVEFRCHISDPQSFTILLIGAPWKKEQHRSNASLSLEKRRSRLVLVNQLSTFHQSTKDFVFLFFDGLERERERDILIITIFRCTLHYTITMFEHIVTRIRYL